MQKLSKRLQAAADFVTEGNRVADIGTDHGFLPIYLVQSGKCPRAIAMDIRQGPLERAREHIADADLESYIQIRLSDGMNGLLQGEADSAVITGMGGLTVIQILEAGKELLPGLKELVLGPQSEIAMVRRWLKEHRMYIDKEDLVLESGKFYPVLHVVMESPDLGAFWLQRKEYVQGILHKQLGDDAGIQRVLEQYGEYPVYAAHPVLPALLERDLKRESEILQRLRESGSAAAGSGCGENRHAQKIKEAEMHVQEIQALLMLSGMLR